MRAARATLLGESPAGQISQDQVAEYLAEHPGSRPGQIADALGVSSGRVSAHLYRAKTTRFVSRSDGWYLREQPGKRAR
ncbi:MAG TPA: helix-turn-helix domain-containing protein [Solirubrobacteraceae bacterium]|nr:helix-turn-helix domain-containing protein [Solirubrobacteraceae bacterium]